MKNMDEKKKLSNFHYLEHVNVVVCVCLGNRMKGIHINDMATEISPENV